MQSYKKYLQTEGNSSNAFERAYRETFLFQLINDVTGQVPDNARSEANYEVQYLTLEQKRRLRNQIYAKALELSAASGKSVADPDLLVEAFVQTPVGKEYAGYIHDNWETANGTQRAKYDAVIRSWTVNQKLSADEAFVTTISPYDPMFVNSDVFDEHDQILYYSHAAGEPEMIRQAYVGKHRTVSASNFGDTANMSEVPVDLEGDVTASGYRILDHYIKTKKDKRDIQNLLVKQYHDMGDQPISQKEADYMSRALQYLSERGFDFDISADYAGHIIASIKGSGRLEIRLLDRETPQYQGRIYDNGRPVYYGLSKQNVVNTPESITTNDRMRLLAYYVGGDDVKMYIDKNAVENSFSSDYYIGQLTGTTIKTGGFEQQRTVAIKNARGSRNSVTMAIKSGIVNGRRVDEPLNIQISSSAVASKESLPEAVFADQLNISDRYFTNPADSQTITAMLSDRGRYSMSFRSTYNTDGDVVSYGIFSDVNGDTYQPGGSVSAKYPEYAADLMLTEDGKLAFKEDISEEHKKFYSAMIVRNELFDWVENAKSNFISQVNIPDMIAKYKENYDLDTDYTYDFSDDELVSNYQMRFWSMLTNANSTEEFYDAEGKKLSMATMTADEKEPYLTQILNSDVDWDLFGNVPELDPEHPGRVITDVYEADEFGNTPHGFRPDNVAKYCQHPHSVSQQKNQSYIIHMLDRLQGYGYSDKECEWISGDSYIAGVMRNNLILFDDSISNDDKYPITLSYRDVHVTGSPQMYGSVEEALEKNKTLSMEGRKALEDLKDSPVRADMMFHTLKALGESGCEPGSLKVTIDRNGIIKYDGEIYQSKKVMQRSSRVQNGKRIYFSAPTKDADAVRPLTGYIGQIFEPDEYGAIHTQYDGDNSKVLIPGYSAFLVPNDPENPTSMRDRLRLSGWQQQMKHAITQEIHRAAFTLNSEYNFNPHTATLNAVYRHMYDMTVDTEDYKRMLAEKDPEQRETNINIIKTLAGRCRFPNEYGDGASTMAQSYLENPTEKEAQRFDYYYSDLYDNQNIRVLTDTFDGIFDRDMTGTAKTAGAVRYLVEGTSVDPVTGKVNATDKDAVCPIMGDPLFANRNLDTWDRRQMASSQILTALHTPRRVGAAMMNVDGWNFDDGFPVTKRFAEANRIKNATRYAEYAERHNGKQPPQELVDIDSVKSLLTGTQDEMYDAVNHVLRHEYVNDYTDPRRSLLCPTTDSGDYPFEYDPDRPESFEEQAAYAIQMAHDCDDLTRPLIAQDKLSDMHGNKGVINRVIDPEFRTSNLLAKQIVPTDPDVQGDNGYAYVSIPVLDENGEEVLDAKGNAVRENVLDFHFIGKPEDPTKCMPNPYRADGNYPFTYDPESDKTFEEQAVYAVQKAFGLHDMDNMLQVFADNPDLDIIMAPYSGMGRFNGGTVHELMSSAADLKVNGKTVEGGMGFVNMIVVDMPADVKTHWYGPEQVAEGKGRKSSGQLSWILQSKHCNAISEMFYGNNQSAIDKLREYAIAIGMDVDKDLKPRIGYAPIGDEKRTLMKLDDITSYFEGDKSPFKMTKSNGVATIAVADNTVKLDPNLTISDRQNTIKKLNDNGGFMELPFQLDFKTDIRAKKAGDENREPYLLQPTNQSYALSDGSTHPTYGLPVLPPNLRASQEFLSGELRTHEYTDKYTSIHAQALLYMACEEQLLHEKDPDVRKVLFSQMKDCKTTAQAALDSLTTDIVDKRFDNKHSLVRDSVMATRVDVSATAVWSADPRLNIDEVAMSSEHARLLGLMDDAGNLIPKGDCRVLVWRDPILHDGGVRYLRVVIDDTIKGIAVHPFIDKSFDGDFDGDSAGVVPVIRGGKTKFNNKASLAHQEAYKAFALESNLLDIGTVIEDGPLKGMHPLYIQDGLDAKSNLDVKDPAISDEERARRQAALDRYADLTKRVNEIERQCKNDPASVTHLNARGKEVSGEQALTLYRKEWLQELNSWVHTACTGIATDHIVVRDKETVMQSMQHIATNGAKGNVKKMRSYADNLGIDYKADENGNFIPGTTKWIMGKDADGNVILSDTIDLKDVISRHTAMGDQRATDNAIQETAAYKADNTSLGGTQSQKGVAALRNQALTAVTRLTYPTTQAILQSKHDPADAKSKDYIVRYWGADVWNGYKLTGDFTGSAEEIQNSKHEPIMDYVIDGMGNRIPKKTYNEATESWEELMRENPKTGEMEVQYEMTPRKCTKDEWIQQMLGMEKALKVDVNPAFIEELASLMEYTGAHQVYNEDGKPMVYGKEKTPIMSSDRVVAGLSTFTAEHGTLLDRMAYTDKFRAMFDEAFKSDAAKESIISGGHEYAEKLMDVMSENYDHKDKAAADAHKTRLKAVRDSQPASSFFMPQKSREVMAGYSIRKTKDEEGNLVYVKGAVSIPGSRKSQMSMNPASMETYMGESTAQYKMRMASNAAAFADKFIAQPEQIPVATPVSQMPAADVSDVPKASPQAANARKADKTSKVDEATNALHVDDMEAEATEAPGLKQ